MRQNIIPVITLLIALLLHASCHKAKKSVYTDTSCTNVVCKNDTRCYQGECRCPNGLEDPDCGSFAADRYIGTWQIKDSISGSTITAKNHTSVVYTITITREEGVYNKFYINGLMGDAANKLECTMENPISLEYTPVKFRMTAMPMSHNAGLVAGSGNSLGTSSFSGKYIALYYVDQSNEQQIDTATFITQRLN